MPDENTGPGAELRDPVRDLFDAVDPVVKQVDLPPARTFALDGIADHPLVVGTDHRLHGLAVGRGGLDHRHVPGSHQREVECPWNRRGRKSEYVDQSEAVLERLLVLHPEALLLVDNHHPDVLENDIRREKTVSPDHEVN